MHVFEPSEELFSADLLASSSVFAATWILGHLKAFSCLSLRLISQARSLEV